MRPPYENTDLLGFGQYFTDHMYLIKYSKGKGWYDGEVKKYEPFAMDPAACVLHYSQEVFEGQKAYISDDGRILMFRPLDNAKRMNRSAKRVCLPEIPVETYMQALKDVILTDKEWIPKAPLTSLYVRPTMIGAERFLGVRPSKEALFFIILSPVGPYYKDGFKPIGIFVEEVMVRSSLGALGDIKAGGNYCASLLAGERAKEKGLSQVLWLDACEHRYIEEVGSSNVFFVFGKKLVTPNLNGSILPGITRDSVITLAKDMGYEIEERPITIDEVLQGIENGTLTESFGTGTAAVISPTGNLYYKDKNYDINNRQPGEITTKLYETLMGIQIGRVPDKYGWVYELGRL